MMRKIICATAVLSLASVCFAQSTDIVPTQLCNVKTVVTATVQMKFPANQAPIPLKGQTIGACSIDPTNALMQQCNVTQQIATIAPMMLTNPPVLTSGQSIVGTCTQQTTGSSTTNG